MSAVQAILPVSPRVAGLDVVVAAKRIDMPRPEPITCAGMLAATGSSRAFFFSRMRIFSSRRGSSAYAATAG